MTIDEIYTPLEEAKKEIWKRWNDKELEKKVNEYLKDNVPPILTKEPKAISTSHVATPNWAFLYFLNGSKEVGLQPTVFEFIDDKFVTTNFDKAYLAKMVFYSGINNRGDALVSSLHSIDLTGKEEKKHIKDIQTLWGENFVNFHHRILNSLYDDVEIYDGSSWYHQMGESASDYYKYVLALYIRNGILFENFLVTKNEGQFTEKVLLPAFDFIYKKFGVKPLIVRIFPQDNMDGNYWWCYPEFVKPMLKKP